MCINSRKDFIFNNNMTRKYLEISLSDVIDVYEEAFTMLLMDTRNHLYKCKDILYSWQLKLSIMHLSILSKLM